MQVIKTLKKVFLEGNKDILFLSLFCAAFIIGLAVAKYGVVGLVPFVIPGAAFAVSLN